MTLSAPSGMSEVRTSPTLNHCFADYFAQGPLATDAVEGGSPVAGNHVVVCMLLGLLRAGFLPAAMTEGDAPASLYYSCSCTGFLPAVATVKPNSGKDTALATEKCRGVDFDVLPAVSAENNIEVSPDPTPLGYISSAV